MFDTWNNLPTPISSTTADRTSHPISDPNQRYSRHARVASRPRLDSVADTLYEVWYPEPMTMNVFPSSSTLATTTHLRRYRDSSALDLEKDASKLNDSQRTSVIRDSDSTHSIPSPPVERLDVPVEPLLSFPHKVAFILVACLAQFLNLGGMNQTVASVMVLSDYFHIHDYGTLSWFSAAYSLTVGTFILPAGRLGDMYGHKKMFTIGWIWFGVWSLITGFSYLSEDIVLFSICRAFQGIGPALLIPNAIALLGMNFPVGTQRNAAFACFGAAGPTGAAAGAFFTAVIVEYAWWPWCFWILAIVCVIVCGISVLIIPGPIFRSTSVQATRPTFDWWGCITGVSGLVLVNFALNQAPLDGWTTWYIPFILILGIIFLGAFIMIELKFTKHPLIPLAGLAPEAYYALGCIAAGWGSHGIWAYYLYLFLEQVKGHSALLTSGQTSPVAVTGLLFALSTPWLVKRFGVATVMLIAMINFFIGSILLATVPLNQTYWAQTFISVLIMPGAMNLSFPAATILLSSALPKEKQGMAASLVSTMVNYCISCGLGLAGSIHRQSFKNAAGLNNGSRGGVQNPPPSALPLLSASPPGLDRIRIQSFRGPWWFAVALSAIGVVIATMFIIRVETQKRSRKSAKVWRQTHWFGAPKEGKT